MSARRLRFEGGVRTVLGFAAAVVVWMVAFVLLEDAVAGFPAWIELVVYVGRFVVLAGIALSVLRYEGVRAAELGLSRQHLGPALAAFVGIWLGSNAVGVGAAAATGNRWAVELVWSTPDPQWAPLPAPWVVSVLVQFLVVGLVEEFVFRGYFQTKMIALLGDDSRLHVALGVVTTSLVFGALHTPGALVSGVPLGGVLGAALLPALTGLFFGAFYELTHNVYFVAALHGLGNTWPVVVEWTNWSESAVAVFFVGVAVVYLGATLGYRYRTTGTERTPTVDREDAGASATFR